MFKINYLLLFIVISIQVQSREIAYLAGGCFWCVESDLEKVKGVTSITSGYSDGEIKNPTYKQVSSGKTKYIESIKVEFNPKLISYEKLLLEFWKVIDPTDEKGQFVDQGYQYTTAIFYINESQRKSAEKSKRWLQSLGLYKKKIITPIIKFKNFYNAEKYHQDYYKKNPIRYKYYRYSSGRDKFIDKVWKNSETLEKIDHIELQYKVAIENGTEAPFKNKYWNNKKEGIYVDTVSKEALFSSKDKFKSGTGWPSFWRPIEKSNIQEISDTKYGMIRTEVRSKNSDIHLGHVFNDHPDRKKKLRYCINSASLEFIPKKDLKKRGLDKYIKIFK